MTTDSQEFLDGAYGGLPITYNKNKVPKEVIDEDTLWEADAKSFNTRIGFITNCSTTLYSMLENDIYSDEEKEELTKRLKICRKEQGNQIDKAKGLFVKPFPKKWTRRIRSDTPNMSPEEIEHSNRLVIDKRPYFMRWLYGDYNRSYGRYERENKSFCFDKTGIELDEILIKEDSKLSQKEREIKEPYIRNNPLLNTNCLMNKLCLHMEKTVKQIKAMEKRTDNESIMDTLKDKELTVANLSEKLNKMDELYKKYKKHKQTLAISKSDLDVKLETIEQYNKVIRQESHSISTNPQELANLAVAICYVSNRDRAFVWNIFGDGLVSNIKKMSNKKISIPFLDEDGDIEYLGSRYSLKEIDIKEEGIEDYDYSM
jgi:hypothetical protein